MTDAGKVAANEVTVAIAVNAMEHLMAKDKSDEASGPAAVAPRSKSTSASTAESNTNKQIDEVRANGIISTI